MNWKAPRASATVSWLPPMLPRGFERVTVAPGSTAPEASVTVPAIAPTPCAVADRGRDITHADTTMMLTKRDPVIVIPLAIRRLWWRGSIEREDTPRLPRCTV